MLAVYDAAPVAPDLRAVLAVAACVAAAWVLLPRVPWLRLYRALDAVEVPAPRAAWAWLCRAVAAVRAVLDPAAEERRRLGRYLAALPPRSGLTEYEEWLSECESLPPAFRAAVRAELRFCRRPSPSVVLSARLNAGRPAVERKVVSALLSGREPGGWKVRRKSVR